MNISFNDSSLDKSFIAGTISRQCGREAFNDFIVMINKLQKEKNDRLFFYELEIYWNMSYRKITLLTIG